MINEIFPIKIYKHQTGDVDKLFDSIKPWLDESYEKTLTNNQGSIRNNGLCSYNASRDLHKNIVFKPVVDIINYHVNIFWKELNYNHIPFIQEMWTNRYSSGSFIDVHNHAPIPLTVSLYLKKESGNIVFENPLETILKHQPYKQLQDRNSYHTLFDYELEINAGDIVIFPGWLKHKTLPNDSNHDRIMIGANINYQL
jgi:uncharacterized protein (TIGR02466 family)